jgi:predicted anti-sigma-YlaC factor YlaD
MITGYLDGELTQAAHQKVRLHVEECEHCRTLLEQLTTLREAAMTTQFVQPDDDQWNEAPKGALSLATRGLGWILGIVWLITISVFGLWQLWQSPESLFEKLLIFGGITAFVLLLISVLADRIRSSRTDRYREVKK